MEGPEAFNAERFPHAVRIVPTMAQAGSDQKVVTVPLLAGLALAATGGPLAIAALFAPGMQGTASPGLVSILGAVVFVAPVAVWVLYSRHIASSGGLFSFVEAAAGRPLAIFQAVAWIISYFMYLPYTVDYVVYDVLPVVFPHLGWEKPFLEVLLALAIFGLAFLRLRTALIVAGVVALAQLALLVALVVATTSHFGVTAGTFGARGPVHQLTSNSLNVSLLYVCVSLPLFLGGETTRGAATVRRGLLWGFGTSSVFIVFGALAWTRARAEVLATPIPGLTLAQETWGHTFAVVVGIGVAASVAGVIIAEYFALGRLVHVLSSWRMRTSSLVVGAAFVVSSAVALVNPQAFYNDLVSPSLVALWVSQIPAFVVYPLFARRRGQLRPLGVTLAAGATALMLYGLVEGLRAALS